MAGLPVTLRRAPGARVFRVGPSGLHLVESSAWHPRPTLVVEVHPMKLFPGLTFSWKRALGVTAAKRKISRATGIPLTRQGRRAKLGKWMGMR